MHSLVDIIGGRAFGLATLAFWISVHEYIDDFIVSGQNGRKFKSGEKTRPSFCLHISPRFHLDRFGFTSWKGGQKSGVAFAKITFKKPHILLLDEPLNHLVSHGEHLISGSVEQQWAVSEGKVTPFAGTFQDYKKILQS